jgi:hypothetical protein
VPKDTAPGGLLAHGTKCVWVEVHENKASDAVGFLVVKAGGPQYRAVTTPAHGPRSPGRARGGLPIGPENAVLYRETCGVSDRVRGEEDFQPTTVEHRCVRLDYLFSYEARREGIRSPGADRGSPLGQSPSRR